MRPTRTTAHTYTVGAPFGNLATVSSSPQKLAVGFVVAVIIGGGGGFALRALAARDRPPSGDGPPPQQASSARVEVEAVRGAARVLGSSGEWRPLREGQTLERPAIIRADGADSSVTVAAEGMRLLAQHDARVVIAHAGGNIVVEVAAGQVSVHAGGTPARVMVPGAQASLSGGTFGLWVKRDQLVVAAVEGEVSLESPKMSAKLPAGREVVLTAEGATPSSMPTVLKIETQRIDRSGGHYLLSGKTAPTAQVVVRQSGRFLDVIVSPTGNFTAQIDSAHPGENELFAYDAAGRRATADQASESIEAFAAVLSKGSRPSGAAPAPAPEAAVAPASARGDPGGGRGGGGAAGKAGEGGAARVDGAKPEHGFARPQPAKVEPKAEPKAEPAAAPPEPEHQEAAAPAAPAEEKPADAPKKEGEPEKGKKADEKTPDLDWN